MVSANSTYSFFATGNRTLLANFSQITYTISISSNPTAGGSASGSGVYNSGSSATVSATPAAGYQFVNWTQGGTAVSANTSYTFTVTSNLTLVANFIRITYTVSVGASPVIGWCCKRRWNIYFRYFSNRYCSAILRLPVCKLD